MELTMQALKIGATFLTKSEKKTSQKGLPEGWTRVTFILKQQHIEKLKSISYWERTTIKELVDEALSKYLIERDFSSTR